MHSLLYLQKKSELDILWCYTIKIYSFSLFSFILCGGKLNGRGFPLLNFSTYFSGNFGCSQEILTIAAMMQIQNIFLIPPNQKSQAVSSVILFFFGTFSISSFPPSILLMCATDCKCI